MASALDLRLLKSSNKIAKCAKEKTVSLGQSLLVPFLNPCLGYLRVHISRLGRQAFLLPITREESELFKPIPAFRKSLLFLT